jgi:hypothetical protein
MSSILPPGLEGNLVEYVQGGVGDWLPFDQKRFYTNAFIIQDDKVCTSITLQQSNGNAQVLRFSSV